jgi:hypothetical protein
MSVSADLERSEALLLTILARFESLAVEQYAASAPELLTPEKQRAVELLRTRVSDDDFLIGTRLLELARGHAMKTLHLLVDGVQQRLHRAACRSSGRRGYPR